GCVEDAVVGKGARRHEAMLVIATGADRARVQLWPATAAVAASGPRTGRVATAFAAAVAARRRPERQREQDGREPRATHAIHDCLLCGRGCPRPLAAPYRKRGASRAGE